MKAPDAPPSSNDDSAPVLLFMHIPKTAGTSLRGALEPAYSAGERLYLYPAADLAGAVEPREFAQLPPPQRRRLRFIMGHFAWGIHESVPGPCRYVTMLRDPVDRVASLYYHFRYITPAAEQGPAATDRDMIRDVGMTLEEWVFDAMRPAADNGMVRQIVGGKLPTFGNCPDSLLTEALRHINQQFAAVLIRGRMGPSLEILSRLTGRPLRSSGRANVNDKREPLADIDPAVRKRIRELNSLDDRLFRLMVERFPATHDSIVGSASSSAQTRSSSSTKAPAQSQQTPARRRELSIGDQTLCFLHVAKTGGTTLRESLKRAYGKEERAFVYEPDRLRGAISREQFADLPRSSRVRLRLVAGHYPYGIHRDVGRSCRYLTVLRDPVERVVSLYYHFQQMHLSRAQRLDPRLRLERLRARRNPMSLEEWVFGQHHLAADNGMTRNLAARSRVRFGQCPDDLLDEALEHVDSHFAAMLVTERLDESVSLMESITGRKLERLGRANTNSKRLPLDQLDPELLQRIRELNHLDVRLYGIARSRLDALLTNARPAG